MDVWDVATESEVAHFAFSELVSFNGTYPSRPDHILPRMDPYLRSPHIVPYRCGRHRTGSRLPPCRLRSMSGEASPSLPMGNSWL